MAIKISTNHQFGPTWRENDKLPKAEQIVVCYNRLTVEDMFEVFRRDARTRVGDGHDVRSTIDE